MRQEEVRLKLEPGIVNVITLNVLVLRHRGDNHVETMERHLCHHWRWGDSESSALDLYRVQDGRLQHTGTIKGVVSVEEVSEDEG